MKIFLSRIHFVVFYVEESYNLKVADLQDINMTLNSLEVLKSVITFAQKNKTFQTIYTPVLLNKICF